jgi:hypothetical protein
MIFGTSFSHRYVSERFRLSPKIAFADLLKMRFSLLRLSCYWSEIENVKGRYDFSQIKTLLLMAQKAKQEIVLTIGMKAMRWPEYYLPKWTNYTEVTKNPERLLAFIKKAICLASNFSCVKYLQIENEPLDKSGPRKLIVPVDILEKEILLARSLSYLPILLTLWGNRSLTDARIYRLGSLADIIGLDLYYQIPDGKGGYWGSADSTNKIGEIINSLSQPVWISELQTNPWKFSINKSWQEIYTKNITEANKLPVETILFWGSEYWYSQGKLKPEVWFKKPTC